MKCAVCRKAPPLAGKNMCGACNAAFDRMYGNGQKAGPATTENPNKEQDMAQQKKAKPVQRAAAATTQQTKRQLTDEEKAANKAKQKAYFARNPRLASKRIKTALALIERFNWTEMGLPGTKAGLAIENLAAAREELLKYADERKAHRPKGGGGGKHFAPSAKVQIVAKAHDQYTGVIPLTNLTVVEQRRNQVVIDTGDGGARAFVPAKHLELVAA